jgi:hypothetical protein
MILFVPGGWHSVCRFYTFPFRTVGERGGLQGAVFTAMVSRISLHANGGCEDKREQHNIAVYN